MKNNFLKKILLGATCLFGLLTMASCQSTNSSEAQFIKEQSVCEIIHVTNGNKDEVRVRVTLAVVNNTIYDIKGGEVQFKVTHADNPVPEVTDFFEIQRYSGFYIPHGVAGYIGGEIVPDQSKYGDITNVEVAAANVTQLTNVWETYMVWWILMIVLSGISLISYSATIFAKGLSADDLAKIMKQHSTSTLVTLMFVLIICLFPLMFSGWMVTVILLGGFLADIILAALLTALRTKMLANKTPTSVQ